MEPSEKCRAYCNKTRYASKSAAERRRSKTYRKTRKGQFKRKLDTLWVYKCDHDPGVWHLTSKERGYGKSVSGHLDRTVSEAELRNNLELFESLVAKK